MRTVNRSNFKITIEELDSGKCIATFWDKTNCLEVDRDVFEFETWGGAADHAFILLDEATRPDPIRGEK